MLKQKQHFRKQYLKNFGVVLFIILAPWSCKHKVVTDVKPTLSDITESVYASVKIRPENSYYPQPTRSGIIKKVFVQEGDLVKKGDILFEITPSADVTNQLTDAEINLLEAKSNYLGNSNLLNNILLEIETTKGELSLDSINFKRQESLWSEKIGKKIDYDQFKLKFQSTQKKLENLKLKYNQTQTNLQNTYKKAINRNQTGKSQLGDFTIKAEFDGKIYVINKEVGDFISSQEKFAEIGSAENFKIEMDIDEVDITKINLGDTVMIQLDAYTGQVFIAKVNKIFPKKYDNTQTFRVESIFVEAPKKIYNGLAGEANIIVSKRKNVLTIPADYLMTNSKVLTLDGEKEVQIGVKNLSFVEIISGIDANTVLHKPIENE